MKTFYGLCRSCKGSESCAFPLETNAALLEMVWSGSHHVAGLNINLYLIAVSFANFDRQRMKRHDVSEEGVPQIVCKSEIFATTVYGHAYNLHS